MIRYTSTREYYDAKLDQLPSANVWSKEETDLLMCLCDDFDLRFTVIADRFAMILKERYDRRNEVLRKREKKANDRNWSHKLC